MNSHLFSSFSGSRGLRLCATAVLISTSGCTLFSSKEPAWVSNPKTAYPDNLYLVAVGAGDTRRAAENAAAASLSQIFESHIESDERLLDKTHETTTSFEQTSDFSSDINILSSQTLYNIQNAEAWKDELGRYHAVAYLNRRDTASIYRDKIEKETTRVNYLRANAETETDLLKKYATLRAANTHALQAEYLLRQLRVIYPPAVPDATPSYSLNQLREALANTARQIKVSVEVSGDEGQRMTATIQELITRYGFMIGKPTVLDIAAKVDVYDTGEREQGLVFVRYELLLQMKDASGNVLITVSDKGREAHKTLDQAQTRSFRTLENAIKKGGAQRLDAYFDSIIDQN
ncbi:LPP20 family lipoprotein [Pontiellaceae bacterium B12219]|nr:LPP20 family lipoprotein [Pontiellaceae bacterium B12219]